MSASTTATQPPSHLFLAGWNKLPDELKLQVLHHAIPSDRYMTQSLFTHDPVAGPEYVALSHILPFLAVPAIAGMALEVLYSRNTLLFTAVPPKLLLPPTRHRKYVKDWWAVVNVKQLYTARFRKLAAVFPNTRLAGLQITGCVNVSHKPRRRARFRKALEAMHVVCFTAQRLYVDYFPPRLRADWSRHVIVPDGLEDVALAKLSVVGREDCLRHSCERRLIRRLGAEEYRTVRVMERWPETAHSAEEQGLRRRTVKEVWKEGARR